jgi:DNA-binding PadR family transcriptional regulator
MSVRHALLGLLAEGPMSGYDVMKRFEHSLGRIWPARANHIYVELRKLEAEGLVVAVGEGARNRRDYALTEAGLAELTVWLRAPPADHALRLEPLLRAHFLWLLRPDEVTAFFEAEARHWRDERAWLAGQMGTLPPDASGPVPYRLAVADAGRRLFEALEAWCEAARRAVPRDVVQPHVAAPPARARRARRPPP